MNQSAGLPLAFHAGLTSFAMDFGIVPKSVTKEGTIEFVPSDEGVKLPQLIPFDGSRVDVDAIGGFPRAAEEGEAESSFRRSWYCLQSQVIDQRVSRYIDDYRTWISLTGADERNIAVLEKRFGAFTIGQLMGRKDAKDDGVGSLQQLAQLLFGCGEAARRYKKDLLKDIHYYFASGLIFASMDTGLGDRIAASALSLAARAAEGSSLYFATPMILELLAEMGDRQRAAEHSVASAHKIIAREWAVDHVGGDSDPESMSLRMMRSMWHAFAASDFETFAEQSWKYGDYLAAKGLHGEGAKAWARSAWAVSEGILSGNDLGTTWRDVRNLLAVARNYFDIARESHMEARAEKLLQEVKRIAVDGKGSY